MSDSASKASQQGVPRDRVPSRALPATVVRPEPISPDRIVAVGYARVAAEETPDGPWSHEAQRKAIVQKCKEEGWDLVAIYEDVGDSGSSIVGRTGLQSAIATLEREEASCLVVLSADRLSRNLPDLLSVMRWIRGNGNLVILREPAADAAKASRARKRRPTRAPAVP